MRKRTSELSQAALGSLAQAALDNARNLLAEARLLSRKKSPRAVVLEIIAIEELGKALLCVAVLISPQERPHWDRFWAHFKDHHAKQRLALDLLGNWAIKGGTASDQHEVDLLRAIVEKEQLLKQAAFYADIDADNLTVQCPTGIMGASLNLDWIEGVLIGLTGFLPGVMGSLNGASLAEVATLSLSVSVSSSRGDKRAFEIKSNDLIDAWWGFRS